MDKKKCPNCGGGYFVWWIDELRQTSLPDRMQYLSSYVDRQPKCYHCGHDLEGFAKGELAPIDRRLLARLGFTKELGSSRIEKTFPGKFGDLTLSLSLNSAKQWVIYTVDHGSADSVDRVFLPQGPKTLRELRQLCAILGLELVGAG